MTMDHVIRPPSEFIVPAWDAARGFPRCIDALESAVRDALVHLWEEPFRRRAYAMARSISGGCKVCGFRESSRLLRSLESLLSLSVENTSGIQRSVCERIFEILVLLKEQAAKASPAAHPAPEKTVG